MEPIGPRQFGRPWLRWLIGIVLGLAVFYLAFGLYWGRGPFLIALPWYVPMADGFVALAALSIAFLAFGRYQARREPAPFWIGSAVSAYAILALFYILSWPGLLPDGRGLIAQLPNTASWLYSLKFSILALLLLAAVFVRWPQAGARGERWWFWLLMAGMVAVAAIAGLSVAFEQFLPLLSVAGTWTTLQTGWLYGLMVVFTAGSVLSARRDRQTADSLFGCAAIMQATLAFAMLAGIIGGQRYDFWWYWQRVVWIAAFSVMLFGLLSEYVALYRRERERTRQLEALQQVTDPYLARQGLELLLKGLLERVVAIMGAHAGAILLLDAERQELVLRKAVGIPKEYADLRMRMGEGLAGRVAAQQAVLWVRDAQADPAAWSPYVKESHIRGMLGAPMRIGDEIIGVVEVNFLVPREFTAEEKRLLEVVAERAALTIHQARLLEEAQEEQGRLRVLIDTAPVGIILYSTEGSPLIFNRAAELILGRPVSPEVGLAEAVAHYDVHRPTGEPFPPEELPSVRALHGETCIGVEMLVRWPSGREVNIMANSAPLRDAEEQIIGAVVAFQDITAIREQERLRDEFLSTAAHELKTPIATIKGYAQLMRQWAPAGHEPREGKAIVVINAQADRINRRVQEMLEAVRFRKAPPELYRSRFDLGDLASDVVQRMQTTTGIHRLLLRREAAAPVEADRERIDEVLVSLLDNAIKYSPGGGDIEVAVWARQGNAGASVTDHGVGIPRERQPHIFEPFYEAVPSGAPGYRSVVALSLYLSKLTIERHGGRIWFESEEGKGSTFHFSLPLAEGDNVRPR